MIGRASMTEVQEGLLPFKQAPSVCALFFSMQDGDVIDAMVQQLGGGSACL